jgi:hypothetical protein
LKVGLYAIWQRHMGKYMTLFTEELAQGADLHIAAKRQFEQALVMNPGAPMVAYPEDYELHFFGLWNKHDGELENLSNECVHRAETVVALYDLDPKAAAVALAEGQRQPLTRPEGLPLTANASRAEIHDA